MKGLHGGSLEILQGLTLIRSELDTHHPRTVTQQEELCSDHTGISGRNADYHTTLIKSLLSGLGFQNSPIA